MSQGEAVQIVSTERVIVDEEETTQLIFHPEALQQLSQAIGDLPVAIISVAGVFRTGKGFVLSLFVEYLNWLVAGGKDSWIKLDKKLKSFHWQSGADGDTKGIFVYNQPFIYTQERKKIAIILMDTQGTFDTQLTAQDTSSIFALSTMFSSVQIYNLKDNITMPALQHLAFFTRLAALTKEKTGSGQIFQTLYFLIRDWSNPSEKPYGAEGGQKLVQKVLKDHRNVNNDLQEVCTQLGENFETVTGFLLPSPGKTVAVDNKNDRTLGEMKIDEEFLSNLRQLFYKLIEKVEPKKMVDGTFLEGTFLVAFFEEYFEAFKNITNPKYDTMLESFNRVSCISASDKTISHYKITMEGQLDNFDGIPSKEELEEAHGIAASAAMDTFEKLVAKNDGVIGEEAREKLMKIFEEQLKLAIADLASGDMNQMRTRLSKLTLAVATLATGAGLLAATVAVPALGAVISHEAVLAAAIPLTLHIIQSLRE